MRFLKRLFVTSTLVCSVSMLPKLQAHEPSSELKQELDRAILFLGIVSNNLRYNDVMGADRNLLQASYIVARYDSDYSLDQAHHSIDTALSLMRSRRLPYYEMVNQVNYLNTRALYYIRSSALYRACERGDDHGRGDHDRGDHDHDRGDDWDHGRGDHGRGEDCKWYSLDGGFTVPAHSGRRVEKGCSNNTESRRVYIRESKVFADRGLNCSSTKINSDKDLLISCRNPSRQNLRVDRVQLYCCRR